MNLILLTEDELEAGLSNDDPRSKHIRGILRKSPVETFDVGLIDGPRGKARIVPSADGRLRLSVDLQELPPPLYPLVLFVGLSRPQTVRRVLRDCTAMGVGGFVFFATDKGESGYSESTLWSSGEVQRLLIDGAQQGFSTRLPFVRRDKDLASCLTGLAEIAKSSFALDNYEASASLATSLQGAHLGTEAPSPPDRKAISRIALFIGAERGWAETERQQFRSADVPLVDLGKRVLRTDVACIAATAIALSTLGF